MICNFPFLVSEQIAANLSMEIRRLHKRKQLQFPPGCASPPHPSQSTSVTDSCPSPPAMDSSCVQTHAAQCSSNSHFNALSPHKRDIPLFTFKQVSMICERMLKERESQIREQYNSVLTCKMAGECVGLSVLEENITLSVKITLSLTDIV